MNKFYTIIATVLVAFSTFAQAPEKMSYQAVIRNSSDALVVNQSVGMRISILQTTATGTAVYVETQTPTTNINGLVSLEIGTGTVVSGDFTTIDWSADSYFIKTETDPTGSTTYTITGTSQLMSVPYALHAKTANTVLNSSWTTNGSDIYNSNTGNVGIGLSVPTEKLDVQGSIKVNGNNGLLHNGSATNYLKFVGNNDTQISGANFLRLKIGGTDKLHVRAAHMVSTVDFGIGHPFNYVPTAKLDVAGTVKIAGPVTATSFSGDGSGLTNLPTELPTNAYTGDMSYWNGSSWSVIVATPNEGATLQMIGGVPTWTGGTPPPPATVGDIRYGGVVFWVDPADNTHGLVCALSDSSSLEEWGCYGTDLPNVPNVDYNGANPVGLGAEIGDGINNTNNILNDCSTASPALATRLLGNEWFLPSIRELNEIYLNRAILEAVPGFVVFQGHYWSSTEINNNYAWRLRFDTGNLYSTIKNATLYYVRAVRAF